MTGESSDEVLLDAVRAGDLRAGGALFRRHAEPMRQAAAHWVRQPAERDDLVAEAFIRVLTAVRAGGGPRAHARPYLVVTMRNLAATWSRRQGRVELYGTVPEPDFAPAEAGVDDRVVRRVDETLAWTAYCALPRRWQTVLWRTEAEGDSPAQAAPLGLSPNGAAVLAKRAREGLRQAYLQAHVPHAGLPRCREVRNGLGAWVRSGSTRRAARIEGHLADCDACRTVTSRLVEVNRSLPAMSRARAATGSHVRAIVGGPRGPRREDEESKCGATVGGKR